MPSLISAYAPAALYSLYDFGCKSGSITEAEATYVNPVVRLREATGNTHKSFTAAEVESGAALAWVTGAGATAAYVASLYDQSGNGRHASQSNINYQPLAITSGAWEVDAGGYKTLVFDGSNDFLSTSSAFTGLSDISKTGSFSSFSVQIVATNEQGYVWSCATGSGVGCAGLFSDNTNWKLNDGTNNTPAGIAKVSGTAKELVTVLYSNSAGSYRINGGTSAAMTYTYTWTASNAAMSIGNRPSGSSAVTYTTGSIMLVCLFTSNQSTNAPAIEKVIAEKLGITLA